MASNSTTRQRRPLQKLASDGGNSDDSKVPPPRRRSRKDSRIEAEDAYSPNLDILRVLTFLFLASSGLSYLISGGESFFWGMQRRPDYLTLAWWKRQYTGPHTMTLTELAMYDGSDMAKPIYLSIDGSIYDVTAGRRMYGPGGSYHGFAGVDATRGFVTGCFAEDRTGDLRGVEEMFLPLDNAEIDAHWTTEALAAKRTEELSEARRRVRDAVQHWADFFRKSPKYPYVGQLVREPGWEGERKPLCKAAAEGRAFREVPKEKEQ